MTGWNEAFPYAVAITDLYPRDAGATYATWEQILKWLDQCLPEEWEYFNGEFRFKTERAKMLFVLKWNP